jgi:hypothetical protein
MGDGKAFRQECRCFIISKVISECLEQMGKIFDKVFLPKIERTSIYAHTGTVVT